MDGKWKPVTEVSKFFLYYYISGKLPGVFWPWPQHHDQGGCTCSSWRTSVSHQQRTAGSRDILCRPSSAKDNRGVERCLHQTRTKQDSALVWYE